MTHRTIEQLREQEEAFKARLAAVRAEIKEREFSAITKLARGYAKTLMAAAKANGGELPSPDQLAAMLTTPATPKRRRRAATAA